MDLESALNATTRAIFELIVEMASQEQDAFTLTE